MYLETGAIPIKWIICQRRLNYLKHILSKEDTELVKKVYLAQKESPNHGDFVQLVEQDMLELNVTSQHLDDLDKVSLKARLKKNATIAAFKFLKLRQSEHKEVKHIQYKTFEVQSYLRSATLHSEEMKTLTAVRSMCLRNIRSNFSKIFKERLNCPLICNKDNPARDTQDHLLVCPKLNTDTKSFLIEQANGQLEDPEEIAKVLFKLVRKRTIILDIIEDTPYPSTVSRGGNP